MVGDIQKGATIINGFRAVKDTNVQIEPKLLDDLLTKQEQQEQEARAQREQNRLAIKQHQELIETDAKHKLRSYSPYNRNAVIEIKSNKPIDTSNIVIDKAGLLGHHKVHIEQPTKQKPKNSLLGKLANRFNQFIDRFIPNAPIDDAVKNATIRVNAKHNVVRISIKSAPQAVINSLINSLGVQDDKNNSFNLNVKLESSRGTHPREVDLGKIYVKANEAAKGIDFKLPQNQKNTLSDKEFDHLNRQVQKGTLLTDHQAKLVNAKIASSQLKNVRSTISEDIIKHLKSGGILTQKWLDENSVTSLNKVEFDALVDRAQKEPLSDAEVELVYNYGKTYQASTIQKPQPKIVKTLSSDFIALSDINPILNDFNDIRGLGNVLREVAKDLVENEKLSTNKESPSFKLNSPLYIANLSEDAGIRDYQINNAIKPFITTTPNEHKEAAYSIEFLKLAVLTGKININDFVKSPLVQQLKDGVEDLYNKLVNQEPNQTGTKVLYMNPSITRDKSTAVAAG